MELSTRRCRRLSWGGGGERSTRDVPHVPVSGGGNTPALEDCPTLDEHFFAIGADGSVAEEEGFRNARI
jgi:hypothetical protein